MKLLRKLAELVVEFPEETGKEQAAQDAPDDVVSAIEDIRRNIESETKPDFEKGGAGSTPVAATSPVGTAPPPDAVASGIKLPVVLTVREVYERAQIKPDADGFDLSKVEAMLSDPEIAGLPLEIKARSVKVALKSMGKELRAVLEEAARRDKALDDYMVYLEHRAGQVSEQVVAANAAIEQEIAAYVQAKQAVIEQQKALLAQVKEALGQYRQAKQAEEQRLFELVSPFVAGGANPVTVNEDQPTTDPQIKQ